MKLQFRSLLLGLLFTFGSASFGFAAWQQPPEQFTNTGQGSNQDVASDANGHALAVFIESPSGPVQASYYTNGAWGTPQTLGTGQVDKSLVAMDATGTGLAIWNEIVSKTVQTAFFNGTTWVTPTPNPLDSLTTGSLNGDAISMNGLGQGAALWIDSFTGNVRSSFFSSGSWTTPVTIDSGGTALVSPSISYSANGTAVAAWLSFSMVNLVTVSNFDGVSWQAPIILGPALTFELETGIDSNGNALVAWAEASGDIVSSTFNGTSWSSPQNISTSPGNLIGVSLAMASNGTAVAVWEDASGNGLSSVYNGTAWGVPVQFATGLALTSPLPPPSASVSIDSNGNALVVYVTEASQILSARLPSGGAFGNYEVVSANPPNPINSIISSLSANGTGFAAWQDMNTESEETNIFASATFVTPPSNITGRICRNRFASQTDRIHIISWTPSNDPLVVSYNIRRNGVLIGNIPSNGAFIFYDHDRCKKPADVYTVTAVIAGGAESDPITIRLK